MPDITMCGGSMIVPESDGTLVRKCVKRHQCYRNTAEPSEFRQSYFVIAPIKMVKGEQHCDEFCPNS